MTAPDVSRPVLPGADLRESTESVLVAEFRAALLMDDDTEELPLDQSFFDLGLTSLRLLEIKQRVEVVLGIEISTTAVFNFPTVSRLVDHLVADVLQTPVSPESSNRS